MLVARSFQYSKPRRTTTSPEDVDEKRSVRSVKMRTGQSKLVEKPVTKKVERPAISEEPSRPATPPISIPRRNNSQTRSQAERMTQAASQSVTSRGTNSKRTIRHDSKALSPSVAALLAVTQIPPRRTHANKRRTSMGNRKISIDELVAEWSMDDVSVASTPASGSPLGMLLSPPTEEHDISEPGSLNDDTDIERHSFTARSISSESVPGLSLDDPSPLDDFSHPTTPVHLRRKPSTLSTISTRPKPSPSPPSEDCLLSHPLLASSSLPSPVDENPPHDLLIETTELRSSPSLTSALTASLSALRARLSSNFAIPPALPPPSHLTRSLIIFPRLTSELRPRPSAQTPTPQLRRYLNPDPHFPPPAAALLDSPLAAFARPVDLEPQDVRLPPVQLTTYTRRAASVPQGRGRDTRSEAGRAAAAGMGVGVRQREPRENSDFLRIVVLEMNMRREGKLEMGAGRARIWLPPRKEEVGEEEGEKERVPRRWRGWNVD